jgi:hypothetical protein
MGVGDVQATPGTFPGATGVPGIPGIPGAAGQLTREQLLKLITQLAQKGGGVPGQAQGQNQNNPTSLQVGQVGATTGQGAPPIPFNTTGAARPPAPPMGGTPQPQQVPMPQNLGSSFPTHGAAVNATAKEAIGGLAELVNNYKKKKQEDETIKAENYFSQLMTASQNPSDPTNQKIIQVLGSDPKVMKTIEKGMEYTFAKEPGGPPGEEPPESHGLKAAIQKLLGKQTQQQQQAQNRPLPAPGQPGGIMLPGPTQSAQLQAQKESGALSAAQQSPEVRAQMSGVGVSPETEAKLSTAERIAAGHDFAKFSVELEKTKSEAAKADAEYTKQMLANKGRIDAGTAVARINAQAKVSAAQIQAQASLLRTLGKAPKEPPVNARNEFSSLNRASGLLDIIMSGHSDQQTYNQFVASLKAGGKTGAAILTSIPGQGSTIQKLQSGVQAATGDKQEKDWSSVQKMLGDTIGTYKKALSTSYPDWKGNQAGGGKAAEGSAANPIVIGGDEKEDEEDDKDEIDVTKDEVK